jgi:dipeptidyl aminopeptidase/acylaminoacyl peptidase
MRKLYPLLILLLVACANAAAPTPTPAAPTPNPTATISPDATRLPTPTPFVVSPNLTVGPLPTLAPPLYDATIPGLSKHQYNGGTIQVIDVITVTNAYTQSLVSYPSDGLKISGILTVPFGKGPFPGLVLVHGYVTPDQYKSGLSTDHASDVYAREGFVTLAPDLRGYAQSDHGLNLFLAGFIIDTVNAGKCLKTLPEVKPQDIGLWGYSMGGGIATRAMVVSDLFKAVVLYAPISADINELQLDPFGDDEKGVTDEIIQSLTDHATDPTLRHDLSPIYFMSQVTAPVSIHVGSADTTAPPQWSQRIRDELKKAGKTVEYFEYPGQNHAITGDVIKIFDGRTLQFFANNLK